MSLADQIRKLHQPIPGYVRVPGIMQSPASCDECYRAWPCKTYKLTTEHFPVGGTDA